MSRYRSSDRIFNQEELYEEFFEARAKKSLEHFRSPEWLPLTEEMRNSFTKAKYRWKLGDKYWKIANEFYNDPSLWWVIAWFNRKPTEAHNKSGDLIFVPVPVEELLSLFKYGVR